LHCQSYTGEKNKKTRYR